MIQTGFERRVKIQQVIANQLPEFLRAESPKSIDFFKQYYVSQEYQGGATDIVENLDQYLKFDNLTPEIISGHTSLTAGITSSDDTVQVASTKGFPQEYGLFKVNDEIITYTGKTATSFTGCIRGFSGITSYHNTLNTEELVFDTTDQAEHADGSVVQNLSALFLKEFYKKLKYSFAPGLEDVDFVDDLDVNNFVKEIRSLYEAKGTEDSFKILFKVLYGVDPQVIDLEDYLIKPSTANYARREEVVVERISGDPNRLVGQTIRKSSDSATQGAVSEVEIFTRSGINTYYKLGLFVGFDDRDLIEGTFEIQSATKVINPVSVGASVITVDSTIGFGQTGTVISGRNTIDYTSKTVNQFLGCTGIGTAIPVATDLRVDESYIGYEDGDLTKPVHVRVGGVLSKFKESGDILLTTEGQKVFVKNVGEKIKNPEFNRTDKEIFANSWIYNTSCRFEVESISGSTFQLTSVIDQSSLKVGDTVDLMSGSTETVMHSNATVSIVDAPNKQVTLGNLAGFVEDPGVIYTIRRKLNTATSSGTPLFYGNDNITSDVQNLYVHEDVGYVAANSLPSYEIQESTISATLANASGSSLQQFNQSTLKFGIIAFDNPVPFITGDEVFYKASADTLVDLPEGTYYVKVLNDTKQIKLYASRSLITPDTFLEFTAPTNDGTHKFILASQKSDIICPSKSLTKFPINRNLAEGKGTSTIPGPIGMMVNGTEIYSYKTNDRIYYGPIKEAKLYNGGNNYDVINPPTVSITSPPSGFTTALATPVVSGNVKEVQVDPQNFDIKDVISVTITGGNGSGAILQPVLETRYRELEFDSRLTVDGGGLDIGNETITFTTQHNLRNGDPIVYSRNGNVAIGIGTFGGSNLNQSLSLASGSVYYAEIVNSTSVKLYDSIAKFNAGINTVGFTTTSQGIHKFRLFEGKKTISSIKVIDPGSGYENRLLKVKPENISTVHDTITFKGHGFSDGEKVVYSTDGTQITDLTTTDQYQIIKLDDDTFRLANAGVGGTITTNYIKKNYVNLTSSGVGFQNFAYPPVTITVNAEFDGVTGIITATPSIRGKIVDLYLYEAGTGYGSTVLNFHKKPDITIKNGKDAELKALVSEGKVVSVQITNSGSEYSSSPDLKVVGGGVAAKLRAVVSDGKITNVVVLNGGAGYTQDNITIEVTSAGSLGVLDVAVRDLTLNAHDRYGDEILIETGGELNYGFVGYSTSIGLNNFNDDSLKHSPIIGWAYDGNPIYGAYGHEDPTDVDSDFKILETGYELAVSDVIDRPGGFSDGFFVEDFKYTASGDLDEHNGRYGKTPEYPNGVYAYHAVITADGLNSKFPFFLGDTYSSPPCLQDVDQTFDFNSSNLRRNTLPYVAGNKFADNDFISEPNELLLQSATIDSITQGSVDGFTVNVPGSGYRVGDVASFDNTDTEGGGVSAYVKEVVGESIVDITTTVEAHSNAVLVWENDTEVSVNVDPSHLFRTNDQIEISGLSTFVSKLAKSHIVGVTSEKTRLLVEAAANSTVGFVTDIFVNKIVDSISVGSTLGIGTETLSVLSIYPDNSVLRVIRGIVGTAQSASSEVTVAPEKFTLPVSVPYFKSDTNDKIFFNPQESVGIGTTIGRSETKKYRIGTRHYDVSVPIQGVYIPNHPFKTGQEVTFERAAGSQQFTVSNLSGGSATFTLPLSGDTQTLFVIKKTNDVIGLTTQVGLTTNTEGLFFRTINSNNDSRDFRYSLESNKTQVTARAEKIKARVSVSTAHGLSNGDIVNLTVKPDQSVGMGTSTSVYLKYNSANDKLLVNPIGFTSFAVNNITDRITLTDHGLKTGDKVFYDASDTVISGVDTGSYYVFKIDDNTINLTNTQYESTSNPPTTVSFGSTGGAQQELAQINPKLTPTRNNNLVFNTSDTSLNGFDLKLYYDREFRNPLVSIGDSTTFTTVGLGTVGVTTTATFTLNYSDDLPSKIYYQLDRGTYISTADTDVSNYSEIVFTDSAYNGTYAISGAAGTVFDVSLKDSPENLEYLPGNTSTLKYSTNSPRAIGGVESLQITFGGANYKKLPTFVSIASTAGINADIIPTSDTIGRINQVTINDPGFDFSADKTLNPDAFVSPNITVADRNTVESIQVDSGGSEYTTPPQLVLINPDTGEVYAESSLIARMQGTAVDRVEIVSIPKGLSDTVSKVYALQNSNGVGISSIVSSVNSGIVTCTLQTPISGFTTQPFVVNDFVFAENIGLASSEGTGFNSADYKYNFFRVTKYTATNPAKVEFDVSPYTTNAGIAVTDAVTTFGNLVNTKKYPSFTVVQIPLDFIIGETLLIKSDNVYTEIDLKVTDNLSDIIKVYGSDELSVNDVIVGKNSGTTATIKKIVENNAIFEIDYSLLTDKGWLNDIGKLNEDYQVVPDNDYYQNLSYSIKSPIEYEDWVNPVNRILHSSGLKNFADTGITSTGKVSTAQTATSSSDALVDIVNTNADGSLMRVDTINFFDFSIDVDITSNPKSRFIKLKNKRLSDYIECRSNRVLTIDNFNNLFSNQENANTTLYKDLEFFSQNDGLSRYFVQIQKPDGSKAQATEIFVVNTPDDDLITVEKASIHSTLDDIASLEAVKEDGRSSLRITPEDPYDTDLDVKFIKNNFNTTLPGIGTASVGFVNLIGNNVSVNAGDTSSIFEGGTGITESVFANIEIINTVTKDKTIVEMFVDHDGTDTYRSETYFDNNILQASESFIGTFTSNIDSGVLSINFENTETDPIRLRSRVVGFGTTTAGIGTHIFKAEGQPDSSVDEGRLESTFKLFPGTGIATVSRYDVSDVKTVKTYAKVTHGSESVLHQVLFNHNNSQTFVTQYPFLPAYGEDDFTEATGIGTFGADIDGDDFELIFYPDAGTAGEVTVQLYSEIIQSGKDLLNVPSVLAYGTQNEQLITNQFDAINGDRTNVFDFDLKHEGVSIFEKQFDPSDSTVVDLATGTFKIKDHFLSHNERVIYTPRTTFIAAGVGSMVMTGGDPLPPNLFAIRVSNDEFRLSLTKDGAAITFQGDGDGNGHTIEMEKKLEKSLINIDGITRSPLAFTPISHTIDHEANVAVAETYIGLSGISSILPGDVLRIDDEFIKVDAVGIGTTTDGPISGSGSVKLVKSERGFVGTLATTHANGATVRLYQGSYNMTRSQIHFTEAPRGNTQELVNQSNIPYHKSTFNGRVYLRNDYSTNQIYDNISRQFTGIGATYTLTVAGLNTTGIETGSGLLFINNIFQTPSTDNNAGGNYTFTESGDPLANTGISSVVFSGVRDNMSDLIISEEDVNQNQLPRGGMIVSLGSTQGLGVAPLVGAAVTAVLSVGEITAIGIGTKDVHGSGYRSPVSIGITDIAYEHRFVSAGINSIRKDTFAATGADAFTATHADYTSRTGEFVITIPGHNLTTSDTIGIDTGGIVFSCSKDHFATEHAYPRSGPTPSSATGDPIVGQLVPITATTTDTVTINVGDGGGAGRDATATVAVGAGGTLVFTVTANGTSYVNPQIDIPPPSYENLPIIGVSRLGIGATTATGSNLLLNVEVGAAITVGIGSTLHEVKNFKITRNGYGFQKGDKFRPVGLVTAYGLTHMVHEPEFEVLEVFSDNFGAWQFGELDFIDSIEPLVDGSRTRFPLMYKGELVSFETNENDLQSVEIDLESILLIYVNGVIQEPFKNYEFVGGTSIVFKTPPKAIEDPTTGEILPDKVDIFFYRGTRGTDSLLVNANASIEPGDVVQLDVTEFSVQQDPRTVYNINTSDKLETNIYTGFGIDDTNFKPMSWTKQKVDKVTAGEVNYKTRDTIEGMVYPTAKVIGDISDSATEIFVDDAQFFNYEENVSSIVIDDVNALLVNTTSEPVSAAATAIVSSTGTITSLDLTAGGSGYSGSATVKIAAPKALGVGVGSTATATATITAGAISALTITSVGEGYSQLNPPQVIVSAPPVSFENLTEIDQVIGYAATITSISAVPGIGGNAKALEFTFTNSNPSTLQAGFPILVKNTAVGNGVTSINGADKSIVGIGTSFLDNVYIVNAFHVDGTTGVATCNILSTTNTVGLGTTGLNITDPRGKLSWGRLSGFSRASAPIAIGVTGLTVDSGLSTYPTIQRRGFGLRSEGPLRKALPD